MLHEAARDTLPLHVRRLDVQRTALIVLAAQSACWRGWGSGDPPELIALLGVLAVAADRGGQLLQLKLGCSWGEALWWMAVVPILALLSLL